MINLIDGVFFARRKDPGEASRWQDHMITRGTNRRPVKRAARPGGGWEYMELDEFARTYGKGDASTPNSSPQTIASEPTDTLDAPRQQAKESVQDGADYAFARASAVPNAGEDLKGSARHRANAWRGLAEAEKDGSAEKLVTKENLLKNEPHKLTATCSPRTALEHLAAHFAINAFPATPYDAKDYEGYVRTANRMAERNSDLPKAKTPEELRKQYLDTYMEYKAEAERLATSSHGDMRKLLDGLREFVGNKIRSLRGQKRSSFGVNIDADYYNPVANNLIKTQNALVTAGRLKANSVAGKTLDFLKKFREKYPGELNHASLDNLHTHVMDILEGESVNATLGTKGDGKERFSAADLYVKHATRKGGRVIAAETVQAGTAFIMDKLQMRGLQWGNSVSDDERVHHLKQAAEAMADLADITGLPDSFMSLGGKLGLAIGARGKGTAMAHYEPGTRVINLTRKNGVGSLAHEWGHALDHFLTNFQISGSGTKLAPNFLSQSISPERFVKAKEGEPKEPRWGYKIDARGRMIVENVSGDPLWSAMQDVRKAWKESGFEERMSKSLSEAVKKGLLSASKRDYWRSNEEMFARSFETHIQHKLRSVGRENTYLAGVMPHSFWPTPEESAKIAPAMDRLLAAVKARHAPGAVLQQGSGLITT